jgi:hypothetical protein
VTKQTTNYWTLLFLYAAVEITSSQHETTITSDRHKTLSKNSCQSLHFVGTIIDILKLYLLLHFFGTAAEI